MIDVTIATQDGASWGVCTEDGGWRAFPTRDFSSSEWAAIQAAAPRELSDDEREVLRGIRLSFSLPLGLTDKMGKRLWTKVVKLCRETEGVLLALERSDEIALLTVYLPSLRHDPRMNFYYKYRLERYCTPMQNVQKLREQAQTIVESSTWSPSKMWLPPKLRRQRNRKFECEDRILDFWLRLGGSLRYGGPLYRFFLAVAKPIMGARTPSQASIRDIVRRKKRRDASIKAYGQNPVRGFFSPLC
jgi:hypothetical protein